MPPRIPLASASKRNSWIGVGKTRQGVSEGWHFIFSVHPFPSESKWGTNILRAYISCRWLYRRGRQPVSLNSCSFRGIFEPFNVGIARPWEYVCARFKNLPLMSLNSILPTDRVHLHRWWATAGPEQTSSLSPPLGGTTCYAPAITWKSRESRTFLRSTFHCPHRFDRNIRLSRWAAKRHAYILNAESWNVGISQVIPPCLTLRCNGSRWMGHEQILSTEARGKHRTFFDVGSIPLEF